MTDLTIGTPDTALASNDPGDDTGRRFRYQWSYAAVTCCMLLDEAENVVEVFCEHHEDVLVKYRDGLFSGLQIKTREGDQKPWKANDEAVTASCVRFVLLEAKFPGCFRTFRFLTNHSLHSAQNGQSLPFVLGGIRLANTASELTDASATFVARIARKSECTIDQTFAALHKTYADDSLPKLSDIEARLMDTLEQVWSRAEDCNYQSVRRAALNLATECGRASTLAHQNLLPAYLPAMVNPVDKELEARINGKRFSRSRVLRMLEDGLNATAPLEGDSEACPTPGVRDRDLLLPKLDAGGFSVVSRNSAVDLRNKADVLGLKWTNKFGRERGLRRYDHVRSLVLNDAARAFELAKSDEEKFGPRMRDELRSRFQQRRSDGSQLYDSSDEHLEGFAYSLTSECQVQWSLDRPWETE